MAIVEVMGPKSFFTIRDRQRIPKEDWVHYDDTLKGSREGKLYGFHEFVDVLSRAHDDGVLTDSMSSILSSNIDFILNNYVFLRNRIVSNENRYVFDIDDESERNAYNILDNITISVGEIKNFINKSGYKDDVDIQTLLRRIDIISEQISIDRQYLPEFKELQNRRIRDSLDRFLDLKDEYNSMSVFGKAFDSIRSSFKNEPTIKEQLDSERREAHKNSSVHYPSSTRLENPHEYIQFIDSRTDEDDTFTKRRAM